MSGSSLMSPKEKASQQKPVLMKGGPVTKLSSQTPFPKQENVLPGNTTPEKQSFIFLHELVTKHYQKQEQPERERPRQTFRINDPWRNHKKFKLPLEKAKKMLHP